jgi:hypothetical protein
LPPYHCELNAIAFIWNVVETKVVHKNFGRIATDIHNVMTHLIENINVGDWKIPVLYMKYRRGRNRTSFFKFSMAVSLDLIDRSVY